MSSEALVDRALDASAINVICNHPSVLPGVGLGADLVDVSALIADPRNIAFLGEHGGALFHSTGPGVYAAHDFFLPEGRGQWALRASREMLSRMFDEYRARLIWAETPVENRACRMFNRWLGFKSEGVSRHAAYPGAEPADYETFVLEHNQCR
ncbi:GNAT family N-acetyltransferase [Sphingomonas beigongshangi]|uniref:GNAT family N-acetyltransferase n=1 Tax=Sphingomonas beigongshangi TaxID=2782540 RepID=UPI001AEDCB64|nr:GNAT family protein [Sphingomonas beigongshangi]